MGILRGIFLSGSTEYVYRLKIALQLSFTVWVVLGIFVFYATVEAGPKMFGTSLLLFAVLLSAPFLPDGSKSYEEIGNHGEFEEE